ncbi:MAG1360 family OppF-related protein [Mycoplasmopsis citelli]|nr:hypothetical protein [Mycoplasmopsis citelli]
MKRNNLLLTIWNMFHYQNKNGQNRFLNIPRIDIYENTSTAFYIDSQYNDFSYSFFWENIIKNNTNTISLWTENSDNKSKKVLLKKEEIQKHISYLELKNIVQKDDNNLPIYTIWKDCLKEYENDKNLKQQLKQTFHLFEISIKNAFYNILFKKSEHIIISNTELIRTMQFLKNNIKSKSAVLSASELLELIENFNKKIILIQNNLFEKYFELFDDLVKHLQIYSDNKLLENGTYQQQEIKEHIMELDFLNKISQASIQKIYNDLKIRDINTEIEFYKNYKNSVSMQGNNQIQVIKHHLKSQLKALKSQIKKYPSNTLSKTQLYKNYFYFKSILKLWTKYENDLQYAPIEEIAQLDKQIISEKLFFNIGNKKNIYKASLFKKYLIYKTIENDFDNIASPTYQISEANRKQIQDKINSLQKRLSKLNNNSFNQSPLKRNVVKIQSLKEKIKLAEADLLWNNLSELKLYKSKLKTKNLKIKQLIASTKKTLKDSNSFFKYIREFIDNHHSKNEILFNDQYINFENFFTQYIDLEIFNEFIILLSNFSLNKIKDSNKFINYFLGVSKFVKAINYLSINSINFFYPYKELTFLEVAKLKLVKYYLNQSKVILIEDDPSVESYHIKNEFFRVFKNIAKDNNITYVFLTEDIKFLLDNFDYLHMFYNNTTIEGGELKSILHNSLHPLTRKILIKKAIKNISLNNVLEDYVFNEFITPNQQNYHYIYSKYGNYKQWKNSQIDIKQNFQNNEEQTFDMKLDKLVEVNLFSFLENMEVDLTNFGRKSNLDRKILPADFTEKFDKPQDNEQAF